MHPDGRRTARACGLAVLVCVGALVSAGCTAGERSERDQVGSTSSYTTAPPATATTLPPPPPARYSPVPGESAVEAKQLASDLVQALASYAEGEGTPEESLARTGPMGGTADLIADAAVLLDPVAASRGEIVYPQLGGLTSTDASVMVVLRQRLDGPGGVREVSRTIDVRLQNTAGGWMVVDIASLGDVDPPPNATQSAQATAVLTNANITMPDTAIWDIREGRVDARVLEVLAEIGADHQIAVSTIVSGHPIEVFGTARPSNHSAGRAVDIWAVDGQPVVLQRQEGSAVHALVRQLLDRGVEELGSPWDLDGPASSASFTNDVHQDHLHIGFHQQ